MVGAQPVPALASQEACSWRYHAQPGQDLGQKPPPLVIGDSIIGWSVKPLARLGFRVDARVCRMWPEGRELVERLRQKGKLPRRIVMALGSNWRIPMYEIEAMLPLLEGRHTMAIVTPREYGGGGGEDAENVRRAAELYPDKIKLLDWVRYSRGNEHWFGGDGLHVKREYTSRHVGCIKQALTRYRKPGHPCSPGGPAASQAACGGVKAANAKKDVAKGKPPLVVGDSVMLLAVEALAKEGFNVNTRGCRMWTEGHALLAQRKRQGRLPKLVVMALGANWTITRDDIGRTRRLLGPKRVLALVTPRESGGWAGSDAANSRAAAKAHPRNVKVIDWVKFSRGHGSWFSGDGLHLSWAGVAAYVRCIRRVLPFATGPRDRGAPTARPRHPCASRL